MLKKNTQPFDQVSRGLNMYQLPFANIPLVGTSLFNEDGSSREELLLKMKSGDLVHLVNDPLNPFAVHAVQVKNIHGVQLGFLSPRISNAIYYKIDSGFYLLGRIQTIKSPANGRQMEVYIDCYQYEIEHSIANFSMANTLTLPSKVERSASVLFEYWMYCWNQDLTFQKMFEHFYISESQVGGHQIREYQAHVSGQIFYMMYDGPVLDSGHGFGNVTLYLDSLPVFRMNIEWQRSSCFPGWYPSLVNVEFMKDGDWLEFVSKVVSSVKKLESAA
jgi:hypothetical protein